MKFDSRNLLIGISLAFIFLYIYAFISDIVYPSYLGVNTLSSLLVFKKNQAGNKIEK